MLQMSETFGKVIGRPGQYVQLSWNLSLASFGAEYTAMFKFFETVGYSADLITLHQEYGALTRLEQYLRQQG